jgi:uncharacterized protein YcbX
MPTVARFNVTPVKSTALHHPERIRLDERGAAGDRRFFLVDASGKRFSGATKAPILPIRATYDEAADRLELRLPNGVVVAGTAEPDGEALEVNFYGRPVTAHVVDGDFTEALSAYAGHEVRLARPTARATRSTSGRSRSSRSNRWPSSRAGASTRARSTRAGSG